MLKKNLHMCFSGIKCLPTSFSQDPALTIDEDEAEDAKYIKYEDDQQQMEEKAEEEAAKSCSNSDTSVAGGGTTTATSDPFSSISDDYEYSLESEEGSQLLNLDFSSVIAGAASRRRFFVSSPGCTNSILDISSYNCKSNTPSPSNNSSRNIDDDGNTPAPEQPLPEGSITTVCTGSTRRSSSTAECSSSSSNDTSCSGNPEESSIKGSVAVRKYSPDPYMDFRTSMVEMIEPSSSSTKDRHEMEFNDNIYQYEYLHELLMCYLSLNTRDTHKYIIAAFMDLLLTYIMDSRC